MTLPCTGCGEALVLLCDSDHLMSGLWRVNRYGTYWWEIARTEGTDGQPYCVDCYEAIVVMEALRR